MVLTMTLRYLIVFGTCIGIVIEANDQEPWNCATAQKCALTLEQNFNESVSQENDSYVIDFCLKKIKDFQTTCLYDAVVRCGWNGNENEYYRLRNVQKKFQDKCSEFCPVMEEIQSCARIVDYGSFIDKKIQSFCLTYKESVSCKNKALSGSKQCSFGEKLFNQDFDEDTLRVFKYICNSECEDLYSAWTVLERCTSTHNLNNTGINCRTYHDLELCISNQSTCPQIHLMVSYFARSYEEHMVKCPLPLPNLPIMDETTMESRSQHHSTTDSKLSKDTSTLNQVLTEDFEKPLTTKDTSMSSNTGVKDGFKMVERSDITCNADNIEIFLPKHLIPEISSITWLDPNCKIGNNGTHFRSKVMHSQCGTSVSLTENNVIFENKIIAHPVETKHPILDFGKSPTEIPVKCIYPRKEMAVSSYRPIQQQVRVYEKRFGHLDIYMRQYETNQFQRPIEDLATPRKLELNSDVFVRVGLLNEGAPGLGIHLDTCIATKTSSPYDNLYIKLIENGCPKVNFVHLLPSPVKETRFSLRVFEFTSSRSDVVYIHCQASICSTNSSQCTTDCSSASRKKRDVTSDSSHLLSMGPLLLVTDSVYPSNLIANVIAGISATVAMVAVVFAVLSRRGKGAKNRDNSDEINT